MIIPFAPLSLYRSKTLAPGLNAPTRESCIVQPGPTSRAMFIILLLILLWAADVHALTLTWDPISAPAGSVVTYKIHAQLTGEEALPPWYVKTVTNNSYPLLLWRELTKQTTKHPTGYYSVGVATVIDGKEGDIQWCTVKYKYTAPVGRPPSALPRIVEVEIWPEIPLVKNLRIIP